jgi:hypothetical protein
MFAVKLISTIICPACGHKETETMPTDACQYLYECRACSALIKPKPGDRCVFCSYGDTPCPPKRPSAQAVSPDLDRPLRRTGQENRARRRRSS